MQIDPEYAYKHKRKSGNISGEVLLGQTFIKFDSGYELLFLCSLPESVIIRRCQHAIAYGKHFYHPDFFLIYPNGKRVIVEIKGFHKNRVDEKRDAALLYIKESGIADDYSLLDTNALIKLGILSGVGGARLWKQIRRLANERTIRFTEAKHREIAKIGCSRYYKNCKNQLNQ
jgi:hypothetical protein